MNPDKNRATTLQSRFGFQDKELSTPRHDEIMLWLDGEIKTLVSQLVDSSGYQKFWEANYPNVPFPGPAFRTIWERPIMAGIASNYMVGFVDMCVEVGAPHMDQNGAISKTFSADQYLWFEVKPAIPSIGETIRQMRMYQQYICSCGSIYNYHSRLFVVCPDIRFESVLRSQGIGFVRCP
jgi:hypothetical protein